MGFEEFEKKMKLAETFNQIDCSGFWEGYRRGLRSYHCGDNFGSREEHNLWMQSANEKSNKQRRDRGLGYRAGFANKDPQAIFKVKSK